MKALSGLQWIDHPYPDTKNLLDFALSRSFQDDSCSFLDQLFVVQQAQKGVTAYRSDDIKKLAFRALAAVGKYKKADGAFSFFPHKSQTSYYQAKVSRGRPVGDLHGIPP